MKCFQGTVVKKGNVSAIRSRLKLVGEDIGHKDLFPGKLKMI